MAQKRLIDTSVIIQAQKGNIAIKKVLLAQENPSISIITACEIISGSANKRQLLYNKEALEGFKVVGVDESISFKSYELIEKYGLRTRFAIADALIAATAIVKEYALWTLNKKHYKPIKEIELLEE